MVSGIEKWLQASVTNLKGTHCLRSGQEMSSVGMITSKPSVLRKIIMSAKCVLRAPWHTPSHILSARLQSTPFLHLSPPIHTQHPKGYTTLEHSNIALSQFNKCL